MELKGEQVVEVPGVGELGIHYMELKDARSYELRASIYVIESITWS